MGRKLKLENRGTILKASYHLFMAHGYNNVSIQDIENESKVQKRSFYRYFKNKDDILSAIIEAIEKKMLEYLQPVLTDNSLLTFVLFTIMKQEYGLANPDYFRMKASLIIRPDTFIKSFMELYALSYPQKHDWKSEESALQKGLYVLGGTLGLQYGFLEEFYGYILHAEGSDFWANLEKKGISESAADTYRRFMDYGIRNNLHVLGLPDEKISGMLEEAYSILKEINIVGFRHYYEDALGFI